MSESQSWFPGSGVGLPKEWEEKRTLKFDEEEGREGIADKVDEVKGVEKEKVAWEEEKEEAEAEEEAEKGEEAEEEEEEVEEDVAGKWREIEVEGDEVDEVEEWIADEFRCEWKHSEDHFTAVKSSSKDL
jgi:hypothetical protein